MSNQPDNHAKTRKLAHRVGVWEGVSYLVLLFVAMPLKYGMGYQEAVRLTGSAHGFLFVGFMAVLFYRNLCNLLFVRFLVFSCSNWCFI